VLLAMAGAQLLLPWSTPDADTLFMVGAAFLCMAIVPVGLTRGIVPKPVAELHFRPRRVFAASQVAVVCAVLGGMVTGSYWTLGPLYARSRGASLGDVSVFLTAVILGGALGQYPLGRLSDRMDRRWVLLAVLGLGCAVCAALWLFADSVPWARLPLAVAFGMACFPIYALCVAHANDNTPDGSFVEVASGILMANGVGSVLGPLVAAPLMARLGPRWLFAAAGSFLLVAFLWTAVRLRVHTAARNYFRPFVPMIRTSATQMEMLLPERPADPGDEDSP
jgi:MFS family permease